MTARWRAWLGGLVLLPGVACVLVAWVSGLTDAGRQWWLLALSLSPYVLLGLGAWGFRCDRGAFLIVLGGAVLIVALGVWGWWAFLAEEDREGFGWMGAFSCSALQLALCTGVLCAAGIQSSDEGQGGPQATKPQTESKGRAGERTDA